MKRFPGQGLFAVLSLIIVSFTFPSYGTNVSGTISQSTTWDLAGSPYIVTGTIYVEGTSSPILTIQSGVTIQFSSGQNLQVGYSYPGGSSLWELQAIQ